jgi:endonuclease/exonuclease/phosphatase family metal-dependent hydrolase
VHSLRRGGLGRAIPMWLAVGAVFAAPNRTAEAADEREPGGRLRVVSYNIRHGAGMDGRVDLERTAAVLQRLDPDLIALQEVDEKCRRSQGVDQAATLGRLLGMEHRFAASRDLDGGRYGLAVLSRLPIKDARRFRLPKRDEPRCCLAVEVVLPGTDELLSFVCVHHDAKHDKMRVRQVEALLAALGATARPAIIAGDFNDTPSSDSLKLLTDAGWTVLDKEGDANVRGTFRADVPTKEIDYIVARGLPPFKIEHRAIHEKVASDHRPLLAVFTFVNDGEAAAKRVVKDPIRE